MDSQKVRVGIIGGAGYTGGELLRLLIHHPNAEIAFVQSGSNSGNPLHKVHSDLFGETNLTFSGKHHFDIDVLFFCAGHGEAKKFVLAHDIPAQIKLIDIGNDFRLAADATVNGRTFIYGLPELNKGEIINASNIANPGCFATTIQLGLLPLAKAGLLKDVYTTGITGSTGAGQSLSATSHFSWRANNIQAYKTLTHQHLGEIYQSLHQLQHSFPAIPSKNSDGDSSLSFVPWRGDFARGIFVSSTVACTIPLPELNEIYTAFYKNALFTHVTTDAVFMKQVVNTNKCLIQLEKSGNKVVVHSVLDNLLKGASGQAVQNMNLVFGLPEYTGLQLKAAFF